MQLKSGGHDWISGPLEDRNDRLTRDTPGVPVNEDVAAKDAALTAE